MIWQKQPPEVFYKKCVLKNFTNFSGTYLCQGLFFDIVPGLRPVTLFKKETLAQVLSCEFCEFFKNIFFTEHLWATASEVSNEYNLKLNFGFVFLNTTAYSRTRRIETFGKWNCEIRWKKRGKSRGNTFIQLW